MLLNLIYFVLLSGSIYFVGKGILTLFKNTFDQHDLLLIFILGFFYLTSLSVLALNIQALFFLLTLFPLLRGIQASVYQLEPSSIQSEILKRKKSLLIYFFILALFALIGSDTIRDYDSYLYHLQSIHWAQIDPLVVGIANIHQRLAFNSVWFNLQAQLGVTSLLGYPLATLNVWIVSQLVAYFFYASKSEKSISSKFSQYLVPALILILSATDPFYRLLRGYSPDIAIIVLTVLFFHQLFLNNKTAEWFLKLFLISILAVWIKLSALPLLVFILITGVLNYKILLKNKKPLLTCLSILLVWIVVFIGSNVIKSGYVLYPISDTRVNVYWAESVESVEHLSNIITSWGKIQAIDSRYFSALNFDWVLTWIHKASSSSLFLIGNSLFFILFSLLYYIKQRDKDAATYIIFLLVFLLYWFVIAPDLRFGLGGIISGIYIGTQTLKSIGLKESYKASLHLAILIPYIILIPFIQNYAYWIITYPKILPEGLLDYPVKETYVNNVKYYVPKQGDDRGDYSHFPSSPKINPCLKQKKEGLFTIFYIDCD